MVVTKRPPLPAGRISSKTECAPSEPAVNEMDISENSRSSLRRSLAQRRPVLTMRESAFLERLIQTGNEVEVQVAHENLLNDKLFFETIDDLGLDDGEVSFRAASTVGSVRSSYTKSMSSLDQLIAEDVARIMHEENSSTTKEPNFSPCGSTDGLGSERRRELLMQRKLSPIHGQIWQAHENGLAVTTMSSRRSMLGRSKSLKPIKTPLHRVDEIFRAHRRSSAARSTHRPCNMVIPPFAGQTKETGDNKVLMDDVRSDDNWRRRSVIPSSPAKTENNVKRPSLRRLSSDTSRKSVTFELPIPTPRQFSDRAVSDSAARVTSADSSLLPPRPKAMLDRQMSDMSRLSEQSFPSLHMAHPVRSYSMRSDATNDSILEENDEDISRPSSPPSIHHGKLMSSSSMNSRQNSITTFDSSTMEWLDEGGDPADMKDEKKEDDDDKGIPTKVIIPTTGDQSDLQENTMVLEEGSSILRRPVMMRHASTGTDGGEGIEVADYDLEMVKEATSPHSNAIHSSGWQWSSIRTSNSFDETMSFGRVSGIFRRGPLIHRSFSDDDIRGMYLGGSRAVFRDSLTTSREVPTTLLQDDPSYRLDDDEMDFYDSWMVIEDEYENGYGGGNTLPFRILGTSATDTTAMPHVLSPPLMESLQAFFPFSKMGENFWLKYSMVRDGASLPSFLRHARGSKYSILAIETTDGEVFGAFVGESWRKNWNFYGSEQTFLWRMRHTRREKTHSIIDQAHMESEIDVFPATGENRCFQLCTDDNIAVGGGNFDPTKSSESLSSDPTLMVKDHEWGYGLTVRDDLLQGTSSPCLTFGSPSLSQTHPDGSLFEIINLELWSLTPCMTLEEAEKLEFGRLFLEKHGRFS